MSHSVMVGLISGRRRPLDRGSIPQTCTFTVTGGLYTCIRSIHIPDDPINRYKSIQAMVIKDCNPIGKKKFKYTYSAKKKCCNNFY